MTDENEVVVQLVDGWSLRSSSGTLMSGDYVRLCDTAGVEVLYWDRTEWMEDPELVMGAILNTAAGISRPTPSCLEHAQVEDILRSRARDRWASDDLEIPDTAIVTPTADNLGHWVTAKVFVPLASGDLAKLTPAWTAADSEAAMTEGWELFDTDGSEGGPWQIQRLDEAGLLSTDTDAWSLVMHGKAPHHQAARRFIQANNPKEWHAMLKAEAS